uniref:non-specific serine/threonine protein kinase n=1 Tax=Cyprinodon variegatus TaxID=28743 RepID=A0A3Q2FT50_CYPVA
MDKTFMETKGYTFIRTLGEGAFGKVLKAESYRLKKLKKEIPRSLIHPNIIRTYDIFTSRNRTVYVVMELCPNGDLKHLSTSKGTLEEGLSCRLFKQLCLAIQYLHGINIAHRDIKCDNLLLDTNYNLKLCDFSFSERLTYNDGKLVLSSDFCGTPNYEAPEILKHLPYNPKLSDVWSMGIVFNEMLFGSLPFKNRNQHKFMQLPMKRRITFPTTSSVSTQAKELIHSILQPVPEHRITILRCDWHPA